ncbi:transketolase [Nonomuraea sp. 3N208]|uniref:transketolase n=1 Tax=Nonomuraea sp. 3N208 TaxID=3457421 RepID=UPI003FD43F33
MDQRAAGLRREVIRLIDRAGMGHYSSTLSCTEILVTLYFRTLRLRPEKPAWPDRDRLLLGKGHVAVGLWPILADLGYLPPEELDTFGRIGSRLTDHPDMTTPGIDFSSGALGHNLSVGVGMALAGRLRGSDHRTFVLLGDGELHEGQVWEAVMAASHYGLAGLVAIVDANGSCADGDTSAVMNIEPIAGRFESFGWRVAEVDGHDLKALAAALDALPEEPIGPPTCVVARTLKGKGVSFMEADPTGWHLGFLGPADRDRALRDLGEDLLREDLSGEDLLGEDVVGEEQA